MSTMTRGEQQMAEYSERVSQNYEKSLNTLAELANKYGYSPVDTVEKLGLSPAQLKQITWNRINPNDLKFYTATRKDHQKVSLITKPAGDGNVFSADLFSPAYYEGHGGNHDFSASELEDNMILALGHTYETSGD